MAYNADNRRLPLLWRTLLLLTIFVVLSQIVIYIWVQHSVKGHFEEMDAEIITHAAFNWRQRLSDLDSQNPNATLSESPYPSLIPKDKHLHSSALDYDLKSVITDKQGQLLATTPASFANELGGNFDLLALRQNNAQQQFVTHINDRHYRAIVIENKQALVLIALPIDVHHQYLLQFNRQLSLILLVITLLLVSIAALSVYWGFAPLSTIMQKMQAIRPDRLDQRLNVDEMPRELRPLAASYNLMLTKLENNFDSLSRFSDNIAHELRTPLATLTTQTQVMLSKPRDTVEYVEQLHHQHDTLAQLSNLINNMLLLAKTQKGLNDSQLKPVNIDALLTKLIDYFELIAEEREIAFEKNGAFGSVLGDDSLLQRLFANLLSNAIYYATSESVIVIKSVTDHSEKTKMTITNQLHEPLAQSETDKLFERFYRQDKDHQHQAGAGLGLSIVQAIAKAHNGKVSIRIKEEYYFEVQIELPSLK